jgi:hypothetical protein
LIAGYGANNFSWDSYLSFTNTKAAPPELFSAPARANTGAALHGWKVNNIGAVFRILHNFTLCPNLIFYCPNRVCKIAPYLFLTSGLASIKVFTVSVDSTG